MNSRNRNLALLIQTACASLIAQRIMLGALRYCDAARRDEVEGFALTAAMEWRKAAEIAAPIPQFADFCWVRWEQIMQLPRRLASPIGDTATLDHYDAVEESSVSLVDIGESGRDSLALAA
jgi:hypothetical protein